MGEKWWRSPWTILGVVVAVPLVGFTIPALVSPHLTVPVATPTPSLAVPGVVSKACGSSSIAAVSTAPPPSPVLQAPIPPPRVGERIFYDSQQNSVLVLGGSDFSTGQPLGDAWRLDAEGWHPEANPATAPGPVVEDPSSGGLMALDGSRSDGAGLETWSWTAGAWTWLAHLPLAAGWEVQGLQPLGAQLVLVAENAARTATQTWTWAPGSTWTRPRSSPSAGIAWRTTSARPRWTS